MAVVLPGGRVVRRNRRGSERGFDVGRTGAVMAGEAECALRGGRDGDQVRGLGRVTAMAHRALTRRHRVRTVDVRLGGEHSGHRESDGCRCGAAATWETNWYRGAPYAGWCLAAATGVAASSTTPRTAFVFFIGAP